MRLPLREKIQNAINRVLQDDGHAYNDYNNNDGLDGALKVGGRRRNRKKKKNKKNGQKKKKSPSLESIKAKLSPPRCRKGSNGSRQQEEDHTPLISDEEDNKQDTDEISDIRVSDYFLANTEFYNQYVLIADPLNTMPLFGKKKKEEPKEEEPPAVEQPPAPAVSNAPDAPAEKVAEPEAEPATLDTESVTEPVTDGGAVTPDKQDNQDSSPPNDNGTVAYTKDSNQADITDDGKIALPGMTTVKSEKSPLITKNGSEGGVTEVNGSGGKGDSKFKDTQPGVLCCTIL